MLLNTESIKQHTWKKSIGTHVYCMGYTNWTVKYYTLLIVTVAVLNILFVAGLFLHESSKSYTVQ